MRPSFTFPTTPHLAGSITSNAEVKLTEEQTEHILTQDLIIEEKLDGSNLGISFQRSSVMLTTRSARDLDEQHENIREVRRFTKECTASLQRTLRERLIVFGEWLYVRHTIGYNSLPSYFIPFDVVDAQTGHFMPPVERYAIFAQARLADPPILFSGSNPDLEELGRRTSIFGDEAVEGIIIRTVRRTSLGDRFKYVKRPVDETMKNLWDPCDYTTNKLI